MKSGGGKSKGSQFERDVCKKLSNWISYDLRDDLFWRSAMSGGRATVGMKKGIVRSNQAGDITSIDPLGQNLIDTFVIECKFYKNIQLHSLLFGTPKNNSIFEFWRVLNEKASELNKDPMLIIKQNGMPTLLCIRESSSTVKKRNFNRILSEDYDMIPLAIFKHTGPAIYLYEFHYFLNIVYPSIIEEYTK